MVAPKDNIMELIEIRQREYGPFKEFVKRCHRKVLDLRAFNYLQALRGLKEGLRIRRSWHNLRNPVIQLYFTIYEQVNRDIEIEKEQAARIRSE